MRRPFGLDGTAKFFVGIGLPGWLGYATFAAEAFGGAPILLGAIVTVHGRNGWLFEAPGGGWEYPAYLFVLCVAQAMLGDGAYGLRPSVRPAVR